MNYEHLSKLYYKNKEQYDQIYRNRFNGEATVKLNIKTKGNQTFIVFNKEIADLIERIHIIASKISSFDMSELATKQFALLCLSNEVYNTNDIEGVYSTRKQINKILQEQNKNAKLAPLTLKYEKLLSGIDIPLTSPQDLRNLYDEILSADTYADDENTRLDGKIFRADSVHITDGFKSVHGGIEGEDNIIVAISDLFDIINSGTLNPLVAIAVLHYFLGYIHPFYDGNGRMMRFLSSYQLSKLFSPLVSFNLSYTIKENKNQYYKILKQTNDENNKGDLTIFVIPFLELVLEAVENLEQFMLKKQEQQQLASERLKHLALTKNEKIIVDTLLTNSIFGTQNMTLEELVQSCGLSNATVRNTIKAHLNYSWFVREQESKHYIYYIDLKGFLDKS